MAAIEAVISDWSDPPGTTISQLLSNRGISGSHLAIELGIDIPASERLLAGGMAIDTLIAQDLSRILGGSEGFWMKREQDYREAQRQSYLLHPDNWLSQFPLKEMKAWGWLSNGNDELQSVLDYFGVETPYEWYRSYSSYFGDVKFKRSEASKDGLGAVSAWLRRAELLADEISCGDWNASKFQEVLEECKRLTLERDPRVIMSRLQELCAPVGVAVVFARAPSGSGISGATRFVGGRTALLCLSFRYLSDDHFWFTFFHEAGHLLLHSEISTFLEDDRNDVSERHECEANAFASELLISERYTDRLRAARNSRFEIARLARAIGVSPGVLVGQLQRDGTIPFNRMNHLKRRYKWVSLET